MLCKPLEILFSKTTQQLRPPLVDRETWMSEIRVLIQFTDSNWSYHEKLILFNPALMTLTIDLFNVKLSLVTLKGLLKIAGL